MKEEGKGLIVSVSGPSGVGKGTVISRVREMRPGFTHSVSVTTRAPRDGEVEGVSYFFRTKEEFDRLFEALISKGKALEINTKSIKKHIDGGFTRNLPDEGVLNRYRAMGGKYITLGSDSHFAGTLAVCYSEAIEYLKSLGFTETVYFKDRKPYFEPL